MNNLYLALCGVLLSGCVGSLGQPKQILVKQDKIKFDNEMYYGGKEISDDYYSYVNYFKDEDPQNVSSMIRIEFGKPKMSIDELVTTRIKRGKNTAKLSQNSTIETNIFEPDEKHNVFHATVEKVEYKSCGLVTLIYAQFFNKNTDKKVIEKIINEKKEKFIKNTPVTACHAL